MKAQKKDATPKYKKLSKILARVEELHEFNPMLGHRGCRLGIVYPEITQMQAQGDIRGRGDPGQEEDKGHTGGHGPAGRHVS